MQPVKMYGALPFKPKLTEFLIDTAEEKLSDTLLYIRQARRLATQEGSPSDEAKEMIEQLEMAFLSQNFGKGKNTQVNDKMADRLFKEYQKKVREEEGADSQDEEAGIKEEGKDDAEASVLEEFISS